jgi:hypothetical protein
MRAPLKSSELLLLEVYWVKGEANHEPFKMRSFDEFKHYRMRQISGYQRT